MQPTFQFDQLYIISDLHFGGQPGFQIFGSTNEMLWFLDHLATVDAEQDIALVINGDFIDFLAEAPALHFDPDGAVTKLERIALHDPAFAPIFTALRHFVSTARRHLIINLGNHDLELALPWVRNRLQEILTQAPPASAADGSTGGMAAVPVAPDASSRLHMIFDGSGVLAQVGGKSVLCVHGNEVDRWNPADFETLRQIGRDIQFGRPVAPWIPNAGSKMVIEVMNPVKKTWPFVDLLKPELEAVVPVLLACDKGLLSKLDEVLAVVAARAAASAIKPDGMLSAPMQALAGPVPRVPDSGAGRTAALMAKKFPGRHALATGRGNPASHADSMMQQAELQARRGTRPIDLVQQTSTRQLGMVEAVVDWFQGKSDSEILRETLERLDEDHHFDLGDEDETFQALDRETGPQIDFLVAGHTHLERAIPRKRGNGVYFNSGTWVRLIQLDKAVRQSPQAFEDWFNTLKHGDMAALDARPDLIKRLCSVVVIRKGSTGAVGELRRVRSSVDATGAGVTGFEPVAGSTFIRN